MYWGRVGQEARLVCTCTVGGLWAKFDNALCDDPTCLSVPFSFGNLSTSLYVC